MAENNRSVRKNASGGFLRLKPKNQKKHALTQQVFHKVFHRVCGKLTPLTTFRGRACGKHNF